MIHFNQENNTFILSNEKISYVMQIRNKRLYHVYFGASVPESPDELYNDYVQPFSPYLEKDWGESLDTRKLEYSVFGSGDFRIPSILLKGKKGVRMDLIYKTYYLDNKFNLENIPHTRGGELLTIVLEDKLHEIEVHLMYKLHTEGAISKQVMIINKSDASIQISKLASGLLDINGNDFDLLELSGNWARERFINKVTPGHGIYKISSTRGASSHQRNPFMALVEKNSNEDYGSVYGFNLIYSSNFSIETEKLTNGLLRVVSGMNQDTTDIHLNSNDSFITPELVIVYSNEGLGQMSRNFHDLYRNKLIHPNFVFKERPVVINSWESFYFDFDEHKIVAFLEDLKKSNLGIDTFVLDDGWFRKNEASKLGDWIPDPDKFRDGLDYVINKCKDLGFNFGLWFEPEMISEDSALYNEKPEWVIHSDSIKPLESRWQFVLDFSIPEVVDYIYDKMANIFRNYPNITYVKWDMNRNISDMSSMDKYHGNILGVYKLYERLTKEFPYIFIEGCSGGGGRFDPGILYYSPQIWTSDNTDAYTRSFIQYGTSLAYPLSAMSNHVTAVPNHQTKRSISLESRSNMAYLGAFGYELNPSLLSEDEKKFIRKQVQTYKKYQQLILKGDLYRLKNPFESEEFGFQLISKDKEEVLIVLMRQQTMGVTMPMTLVKPKALDPNKCYKIMDSEKVFYGKTLMNAGLDISYENIDYATKVIHLIAVE